MKFCDGSLCLRSLARGRNVRGESVCQVWGAYRTAATSPVRDLLARGVLEHGPLGIADRLLDLRYVEPRLSEVGGGNFVEFRGRRLCVRGCSK